MLCWIQGLDGFDIGKAGWNPDLSLSAFGVLFVASLGLTESIQIK